MPAAQGHPGEVGRGIGCPGNQNDKKDRELDIWVEHNNGKDKTILSQCQLIYDTLIKMTNQWVKLIKPTEQIGVIILGDGPMKTDLVRMAPHDSARLKVILPEVFS